MNNCIKWFDMDGTVLQVGDTVAFTQLCLYVPKLYRGVIETIEDHAVFIRCEDGLLSGVQDERSLLYLFT